MSSVNMNPKLFYNLRKYQDEIDIKHRGTKTVSFYEYLYYYEYNKIIDIMNSAENIYVSADLHLNDPIRWKRHFPDEIHAKHNAVVTDNDVWIFLGDLVDEDFRINKNWLKRYIQTLKGRKLMVLGNNDTLSETFYKECGFEYVVSNFIWKDMLFTHMPVDVGGTYINIHGHIHGSKMYFNTRYVNQKDACIDSNKMFPYKLIDLCRTPSKGWSSYSKNYEELASKKEVDIIETNN